MPSTSTSPASALTPRHEPFLIIAGVSKAGTTSLFTYLSGHPEVVPCPVKEPWMNPRMDFPCGPRATEASLRAYLALFPDDSAQRTRLEGSTAYFGKPGVPERLAGALPRSRIILSLRDPIDRLLSWHRFSIFHRQLPESLTFDQYVRKLFLHQDNESAPPIYREPLQLGLYSGHIKRWHDVFGRERVLTLWFDTLTREPESVMCRVAQFANLDPAYFRGFRFTKENPTQQMRARRLRDALLGIKRIVGSAIPRNSSLRRVLRPFAVGSQAAVDRLTIRPQPATIPQPETLENLIAFYRDDVTNLAELLGEQPPWHRRYVRQAPP